MYRKIRLSSARTAQRPEAWVVPMTSQTAQSLPAKLVPDKDAMDAIRQAVRRPEFKADQGWVQRVDPPKGPTRVILVGLGKGEKVDADAYRQAAAAVVRAAFDAKLTCLQWVGLKHTAQQVKVPVAAAAIGDGLSLANFTFTDYQGSASNNDHKPLDLAVRVEGNAKSSAALRDALILGQCVATARTLSATPPNIANPAYITRTCRSLARRTGLRCNVINQAKAEQLGMGGLLAVGRGGSTPPAVITLEWQPRAPGGTGKEAPILLVGKAVTFDTGGYSLKPGGGKGMKYDKCGGMAVIGIMEAVARLNIKQRVVALIPCVENMIDQQAYRVDDIITLTNGVTCEVTNTDAEGRLILADALAYGTKHYKPHTVIDLATLTGGVVVALGPYGAGLFSNNDALAAQLIDVGERTGERLWRLPLWQEVRDLMKGSHADLVNSASQRWAHPGQGAGFLSYFVGPEAPKQMPTLPWVHLDIAGTASTDSDTPLHTKGPTGFGVRLLVQWLQNQR